MPLIVVLLLLFSSCKHSIYENSLAKEYPHINYELGYRWGGKMMRRESEESLTRLYKNFCKEWANLRQKDEVKDCMEKAHFIKIKLWDRHFHPSKAEDSYKVGNDYPLRAFNGVYQSRGYVHVYAKGVNWGDTALSHELVHAIDHLNGMSSCPSHQEACGWGADTWTMINNFDAKHGRGDHNWHGLSIE